MFRDEQYVVMPWMAKNDDVQGRTIMFHVTDKHKFLHPGM